MTNTNLKIEEFKPAEIEEVSWLLANSMSTNPNHLAMFRSANLPEIKIQQRMFDMVLRDQNNKSFTAKLNGQIVGIMAYTTSDRCQMSPFTMLRALPKFINIFGKYLLPVLKWRMNWGKHDHKCSHIHFGPLAVDKNQQGKGIGKALLKHFCDYLDNTQQIGYLETDKKENVPLYEKFGFKVVETDELRGVRNWFMVRELVF